MTIPATDNVADLAAATRQDAIIGKLLVEAGKIKPADSERILKLQQTEQLRFGEAAIKLGLATESDIQHALASQYRFAYLSPGEQGYSAELLTAYQPFTPQVESLRALRTQLKLRWFNDTRKRLAIIAPRAGTGCSFHAANLAVVFAQMGARTLLIDGDLRHPRQHAIFNQAAHQGLAEVLGERISQAPIIPLPRLGSLSLLTAGAEPPNPGELLSRGILHGLLEQLDAHYDVILIDTPPAAVYADAQAIAAASGGALFIARENQTRLNELAALRQDLAATGTEIAGVVLNKF